MRRIEIWNCKKCRRQVMECPVRHIWDSETDVDRGASLCLVAADLGCKEAQRMLHMDDRRARARRLP
jgi:hypothetical protein